jgi:hypothetical protein
MSNKMALDALTAIVEADDAQCLGQSHIEQARAAIAALQAEPQGWKPIETAPKEWILLLGYFNESGKWRTVRGEWFCQEEIDDQWEFPENGRPGWYETCVNADDPPNCWPIEPTHWMPLPTPPKD